MIEFNIRALFKLRGINEPLVAMRKLGIGQNIASKFLTGKKDYILKDHIEKLCRLLRCTPNDLFVWTPDNDAEDFAENPLQKIRKTDLPELDKYISNLSVEELKEKLGE